jgi:hypothetical protein
LAFPHFIGSQTHMGFTNMYLVLQQLRNQESNIHSNVIDTHTFEQQRYFAIQGKMRVFAN